MTGKGHLVTGVCTGVLVMFTGEAAAAHLPPMIGQIHGILLRELLPEMAGLGFCLCFAAYVLGLLLPDVDQKNSMLGRFIHIPVEHRTWLHAIYPYLLLLSAGHKLHPAFYWVFAGVCVHLFWDGLSLQGNCWLYKLASDYESTETGGKVKKHHRLKLYRTGGFSEFLVICCVTAVTVACCYFCVR